MPNSMNNPLSLLKGSTSASLMIINTVFWCTLLLLLAILKLIVPVLGVRKFLSRLLVSIAQNWISFNSLVLKHISGIRISTDIDGNFDLSKSHLVMANHQSWADILILQSLLNRRIPFLRFFLKRQLIWVPVLGLAWWALDFPFMRRHSKAFIKKNPEMAGKDLESTRKACEKFRQQPVSVMNFVEGTRFSHEKHQRQHSDYTRLLKPKAGGAGYVLTILGDQISHAVDITLQYPSGAPGFLAFLCGDCPQVNAVIEVSEIPESVRCDYVGNKNCRVQVQRWINRLWREKEQTLARLERESAVPTDRQPG